MSVRIHGRHFLDTEGRVLYPRGVNVSSCSKVCVFTLTSLFKTDSLQSLVRSLGGLVKSFGDKLHQPALSIRRGAGPLATPETMGSYVPYVLEIRDPIRRLRVLIPWEVRVNVTWEAVEHAGPYVSFVFSRFMLKVYVVESMMTSTFGICAN